jgi:hypothetical protein
MPTEEVAFGDNVALGMNCDAWWECGSRECGVLTRTTGWFSSSDYNIEPLTASPPYILSSHLSSDEWAHVLKGYRECEAALPSPLMALMLRLLFFVPIIGCFAIMCCISSKYHRKYLEALQQHAGQLTQSGVGGGRLLFEAKFVNGTPLSDSRGERSGSAAVLDIRLAGTVRVQIPKKYQPGDAIPVQTRSGVIQVVAPSGLKPEQWFALWDDGQPLSLPAGRRPPAMQVGAA